MPYQLVTKRLLLLLAVFSCLLLLVWFAGEYYLDLLIPLYEFVINVGLPNQYEVVSISQHGGNRGQALDVIIQATERFKLGSQSISPGTAVTSSTLKGHAFQIPVIALGILLAWPMQSLQRKLIIVAIAIPVIIFAGLIDVPFVILGSFLDLVLFTANPKAEPQHFYITWMDLMNDGGRIALGVTLAFMLIAFNHLYESKKKTQTNKSKKNKM